MPWILVAFISLSPFVAPLQADAASGVQYPGIREYQWFDSTRDRTLRVAVWYPTLDQPTAIAYGPFTVHARADASMVPGEHPLILISHGTGGHRLNQVYLAQDLAAHGYIVLAVQHPKNSAGDDGDANLLKNLWNRPKDVSFALDQALKEPGLAPHLDPAKIGVIGHSLGGYTALTLAGAKPDIDRLDKFCGSIRGWFAGEFCGPKKPELAAWRKGDFQDFSRLQDPRIRAVFAMAPGVPILFDKAAMSALRVPVFVALSGRDEVLRGREEAYREYLPPGTVFAEFPDAGHYVYIMECPEEIKQKVPVACSDIGTPRAEVHPVLRKQALSFFNRVFEASK